MFLNGHLARVEIQSPSQVATLSGIRIGSSEADVQRTYPGRITVQPHPYVPGGHYLVYTSTSDVGRLLIFETDGKTVTSFRAGQKDAVELTEGCA